jgi:hypothetical protein
MFKLLRSAALSVALAATMLTTMLTAAPALAAGTATLSFNPTSTSFAVGASFSVPAQVAIAGGTSLGDQFGITYDPNVLTLNSASDGSFYSSYAASQSGCSVFNQPWAPPSTAGQSLVGADGLLGSCGAGASGTGTIATFNFTAKPGVNALTSLAFTAVSTTGTQVNGITSVTVTPITLTIGTPPAPHLTISNQTTTAVSGTPTEFNVSFQVNNTGTANGTATTASVAVTGATPASASVNVPALNQGTNSGTLTAGPFTLNSGTTLANVTITADAAGTTGGPATGTTAYQYSALSSSGNTTLNASLAASIQLTAPQNVTSWTLTPGQTNQYSTNENLTVNSNVNFAVTAADANAANNGHFTQWNGTTFLTPLVQLLNALVIQPNNSSAQDLTLSGTPQTLLSGTRSAEPASGYVFPIDFIQNVGFNDAPVNAPNSYYEVVAFVASGSF